MANGSGVKTNEREGTRAQAKYIRISAYKVREVLDLIRGEHVQRAAEILRYTQRDAAHVVGKVLASAVANAENNDGLDADDLYVSTAYADEGVTLKRFRPRARGRAGRIRKRTCHVTVIVSRMPEDQLRRFHAKQQAEVAARRARRVAGGRAAQSQTEQQAEQSRASRFRRNRRGGAAAPAGAADVEDQIETEETIEDVETAEVIEATTEAQSEAVDAPGAEGSDSDEAQSRAASEAQSEAVDRENE